MVISVILANGIPGEVLNNESLGSGFEVTLDIKILI